MHKNEQPFLTDVTHLRAKARSSIDQGAVTPNLQGDVSQTIEILQSVLATEEVRQQKLVEQFKALAYDAFRDARFRFRLCPECRRPFVPVRRQSYCSSACSQAQRTRKWRSTHRDKVRKMRRDQYRRSITGKLKVSKHAATRIRSSTLAAAPSMNARLHSGATGWVEGPTARHES